MLTVYRSNRAEWLAKLLAEQLRLNPPAPFEKVDIIVNTWPTSRWLGERLAIVNGINAQVTFPFPGTYLKKLVRKIIDLEFKTEDPWNTSQLVWPILEVLPELIEREEGIRIKDWLNKQDYKRGEYIENTEWQLAKSIAKVFDEYMIYRPEEINTWWNTNDINSPGIRTLPNSMKWQPILLKLLKKKINEEPICIQIQKAINKLRHKEEINCKIPRQINIFGLSCLAPIHVQFIQALSSIIEIKIYLLTPCKDLWQRSKTRRKDLVNDWTNPPNGDWLINSPRLEANFGRMGAEFQQLLEGSGEYQLAESTEEDLFAAPIKIATNAGRQPTLLDQLQQELISVKNKTSLTRSSTDDSLIFVASPGMRRQVQLVRDQIIQWLALNKELEPRDILIMTPQINRFAPLIASSFNDTSSTNVQLPWCVTDRNQEEIPGIIKFVLDLLEISNTKITSTNLIQLLSNPAIKGQHGIDQEDINKISDSLQKTGFRWGIDCQERKGNETHSLKWSLDRWLLGIIIPSKTALPSEDIAPFHGVLQLNELNNWWDLIFNVYNYTKKLREPRACKDWINLLKNLVDDFFNDGGDWFLEKQKYYDALEKWNKAAGQTNFKIDSSIVKDILCQIISTDRGRFGHRSGKITISSLEPMRAIPHKIIVLMGLDENIFPRRSENPGFSLIQMKKMLGDPSICEKDRYVILEALISSRQHLLITWNSKNEKTGENLEGSNPIKQLLEYLRNELKNEDFNGLLRQPPSNPIHRDNFIKKNNINSISCDKRYLEARKWLDKKISPKTIALAYPFNWFINEKEESQQSSYLDLSSWLLSPQTFWLRHNQINTREEFNEINNKDPLIIDELKRYELIKNRLINLIEEPENNDNNWLKELKGQGIMPPFSAEYIETNILLERWENLSSKIIEYGLPIRETIELENESIDILNSQENMLFIEIGYIKYKSIMQAWFNHLIASTTNNYKKSTVIIGRKTNQNKKYIYEAIYKIDPLEIEDAIKILNMLRLLASIGANKCWPLPPESGLAMAFSRFHGKGNEYEVFSKSWVGDYRRKGERELNHMQLCFGRDTESKYFLEDNIFQSEFNKIYQPMFKYLKRI